MTDLPSGTLPIVVETNRSAVNEEGVTRIYLSTRGTRISLTRQSIHLREGMNLHMYSEDADVNGQCDDLVFGGVVHWSTWKGANGRPMSLSDNSGVCQRHSEIRSTGHAQLTGRRYSTLRKHGLWRLSPGSVPGRRTMFIDRSAVVLMTRTSAREMNANLYGCTRDGAASRWSAAGGATSAKDAIHPTGHPVDRQQPGRLSCHDCAVRCQRVESVPRSRKIACAALWPGAPVTSPPGCVPAPHKYRPLMGVR
jgi:hypothetical protein